VERSDLDLVVEHIIELVVNSPVAAEYCIGKANLLVGRLCLDTEEAIDWEWWRAHNKALTELLAAAANR
jgi:hypothetical protein